jgi:peptide chain release factor 1
VLPRAARTPSYSSSSSSPSTSAYVGGGLFSVELVDERAGVAVMRISGKGAAELFAGEAGGHRWQRIPPTERKGRVQTSTITVAVLAEPKEHELVLRDEDLEVTTMRGSGAGGQHRNKTDSAVRIRHLPTGVEVRCESERSQTLNKDTAMVVLRARILEERRATAAGERDADRRRQVGSGMRGDKRRTIRVRDDQVNDHQDGRAWSFKRYARGDW